LVQSQPPSVLVEGQNVITTQVIESGLSERPSHDTIEAILEWLGGEARRLDSSVRVVDELAWRLLAAGVSLVRLTLHSRTLHPQFLGATYVWWRDTGRTQEVMIGHELADLVPYEQNPVLRVVQGGETLRRRLDGPEAEFDFSILHDLKARGGVEYFALPVVSAVASQDHMVTYVTDRPGGFSEREITDLSAGAARLSAIADLNGQKKIAENVLTAYLGPQTGPKVLAGQIRRGSGEAISAVLWSSDLRGFTQLSDHLPGERVIAILNELFDLQAHAIAGHGGEILKFVGDGLLAIFPVANPDDAPRAARNALAAAHEALAALSARVALESEAREAPLKIVIALHYGTVIYGNIGAADRLDFTVIGPAVNLVSRVEGVAKSLDLPLVVSDNFADAYGGGLTSLGRHQLRGLEQPHELFAPMVA
jgi:adenylate cyclase